MALTLAELLAGLGPAAAAARYEDCGPETTVTGLQVDSRRISEGDAFLAVAGVESDGHRYLRQARAAGARALIISADRLESDTDAVAASRGVPHVVLPSTSAALPVVAGNATGWPGRQLRLAGVTGTNGKTTTTYFVEGALRASNRIFARLGTTGHWLADRPAPTGFTTPFPLELQSLLATALSRGATDAVMEVSSHGLDQDRVAPLRFDAVALTSFSQDHLDYHPSMAAYLEAKLRLASVYGKAGGVAVAATSVGEPTTAFLAAARSAGMRVWHAGEREAGAPSPELLAEDVILDDAGITARVHTPAGAFELRTSLVGRYNLDNALVATGLALGLGLDLEAIAAGLADARAPGRLERVTLDDEPAAAPGPSVFVDYAHTPDAVARALAALRPGVRGELWVLLGCGGDRDPSKRPLMGAAASEGSDLFYATSDNPRTEDPDAIVDQMLAGVPEGARVVREVDRGEAIAQAIAAATPDDTILIAGKGHEDYQVLGTEKIDFDDRVHAREALRRRVTPRR